MKKVLHDTDEALAVDLDDHSIDTLGVDLVLGVYVVDVPDLIVVDLQEGQENVLWTMIVKSIDSLLGVDLVLGINVVDVSEGDLIVDGLQEG